MEVEMKIRGLMMDPVTNMPIVVLKDVQGQAILPIWVGVYEANAIALEIEKVQTPRPNTPSLSMPDAISEEEKSRRLGVLQEKQREIQGERNATLVGTSFDVFVSGKSRRENQWSGQTSCHRVINFTSQRRELLGTYVQVLVTGAGPNSLVGEQVT